MSAREDALDAFCRVEHPRLVGALSLYCGEIGVAEEVAQEALTQLPGDAATLEVPDAR